MTYSPRIVYTDTCVHFITKAGNGTQVCNPLGILDRMGLAAEFGYHHELRYVSLYQLIDHRHVLFGSVAVHTTLYLLLDVILSDAPCSPDNNGSHTSNGCY
jgi:hypothetical protein